MNNADYTKLNKAFDSRIRLGIMGILMVSEKVSFNQLKDALDITSGNLASHLKSLEEPQYITVFKGFVGRKSNTTYQVTQLGYNAFKEHLNTLENIIKSI